MAEKGAMTFSFDPTPELRDLLGLRDREYVVKNPVEIVVETQDGGRLTPPQEVRERIVRGRDCIYANNYNGEWLDCSHFSEWDYYAAVPGHCPVRPDDFCSYGETEDGE